MKSDKNKINYNIYDSSGMTSISQFNNGTSDFYQFRPDQSTLATKNEIKINY